VLKPCSRDVVVWQEYVRWGRLMASVLGLLGGLPEYLGKPSLPTIYQNSNTDSSRSFIERRVIQLLSFLGLHGLTGYPRQLGGNFVLGY